MATKIKPMHRLLSLLVILFWSSVVIAQPLRVAVAANAQFVMKSLQSDFKNKTGITIETIVGSSGKLSAQIKNGAPFDFFLSADMDFPNALYRDGMGLNKPKVYALGSLIVCNTVGLDIQNWKSFLSGNKINKIAIANPALAPYGKAAEETLRHYGLWDKVRTKIVLAESIAQVNTYITTGVVSLGFTTAAFLHENRESGKLKWQKVDPKVYAPIKQGMLVLIHAKKGNYDKAMKFYNYLQSAEARQLLISRGYSIP